LIFTIAENDKLSKVIHLPIQSGSNEILKAMNRKYTKEHYMGLISLIRQYIPDAYISTDIIVGFPGETEKNFMDTYNLVNEVKYDGVFAFMFSRRSGTIADTLPNQIDEETKKNRIHKLLELSKQITKEKNKNLIGKIFNVIAIKESQFGYEVMTDSGKTMFINHNLQPNQFYKVKVIKFANNRIFGELI
jgi:tRNA-2-methylthio-N6-dimethylallyladenosine synthase